MNAYIGTKYERDIGSMNYNQIIKTLNRKSPETWEEEHNKRLLLAAEMMKELKIGRRIYEFHDADIISGKRIKTFSDHLKDSYEVNLVSPKLENGYIDGINMIRSENGNYHTLKPYITYSDFNEKNENKNSLSKNSSIISYSIMDSIIFDNVYCNTKHYLKSALALGIDCYFPIIGYEFSLNSKKELDDMDKLKEFIIKTIPTISMEEFESKNEEKNSFVKVIKMSTKK